MKGVLKFVNEKAKILLIIKEKQIDIEGKRICPLNQQEIAKLVPCGKVKTNQLIKALIDEGYIEMAHSKGRYIITEQGNKLLEELSLCD